MRIAVINPTTSASFNPMLEREARRYAHAGTEIEVVGVGWGPSSIEGHFDEELSAVAMLELIAREASRFDGFVITCYGDPGLYAARELSPVPVVGISEASMLLACTVAYRFSIVTTFARVLPMVEAAVRLHGLQARCASVRATTLSVLDTERDPDRTWTELLKVARTAIAEDRAEAILLGCGGFSHLDKRAQEELQVPVIDGLSAAVKLLESILEYGLTTSRAAAFKQPELKEIQVATNALTAFRRPAPSAP